MMVLVDTSVWSLALRRKRGSLSRSEQTLSQRLREVIREGRAQIVGPIRQELLSGLREEEQYRRLRDYLSAFEEPRLDRHDYEEAAGLSNLCRGRGIAGSAIDFFICAVAHRRDWQVFTTDHDFGRYAEVFPLKLH